MVDYLSEIPLPGRILAPPVARADQRVSKSSPIGFVAGAENRLVASAVQRLMNTVPSPSHKPPARGFSPRILALFGPSGTGKTHLTHGLVRYWNEHRGSESAIYLPAGDFYRQLLDAIKRDAIFDLRRTLRAHELLAIDDLHQLPAQDYVSQELRATLDAYEEDGGTVIVASRRPADTLANISADVRSRLASGLMLQLAPPGNAARVRIIRRASESLGQPLSDRLASDLATSVRGTANDLFGAVFEFCAQTKTTDHANGDSSTAKQFLAARAARQPTLREILAAVAKYYNLPQAHLKSQSRRKSIVAARAIAIYLAREVVAATYEQIGRSLGGRDHTTVIHNYQKIERDRTRDPAVQEAIEELTRRLCSR